MYWYKLNDWSLRVHSKGNTGDCDTDIDKATKLIEKRIKNNDKRIEVVDKKKEERNNYWQEDEEKKYADNYEDYIESLQFIDRKFLLTNRKQSKTNIIQRILYKFFSKSDEDPHVKVARDVYNRLRLRSAQLRELEEQARGYLVNNDLKTDSFSKPFSSKYNSDTLSIGSRAYRLAVTDLFVEKAMAYLENRANDYKKGGQKMIRNGQLAYGIGALIACIAMTPLTFKVDNYEIGIPDLCTIPMPLPTPFIDHSSPPLREKLTEKITKTDASKVTTTIIKTEYNTTDVWLSFTKSFSALGMVVLFGVSMIRYGKVMLEQAERLLERRHALRQGRLFVHLNDGKLKLDEMEDAFNWNVTASNAFTNLPTEAQAPWGTVVNQIVHKVPDQPCERCRVGIDAVMGIRRSPLGVRQFVIFDLIVYSIF